MDKSCSSQACPHTATGPQNANTPEPRGTRAQAESSRRVRTDSYSGVSSSRWAAFSSSSQNRRRLWSLGTSWSQELNCSIRVRKWC